MRKAYFHIDETEIASFGYTNGNTWNGWACPWFTFEQATDLMNIINSCKFSDSLVIFDEENDCFIEYECGEVNEDDAVRYYGKDIDGMHLYPFGDGYIWDEKEMDEREERQQMLQNVPEALRQVGNFFYIASGDLNEVYADVYIGSGTICVTDHFTPIQQWFGESDDEDGAAAAWRYIIGHYGTNFRFAK